MQLWQFIVCGVSLSFSDHTITFLSAELPRKRFLPLPGHQVLLISGDVHRRHEPCVSLQRIDQREALRSTVMARDASVVAARVELLGRGENERANGHRVVCEVKTNKKAKRTVQSVQHAQFGEVEKRERAVFVAGGEEIALGGLGVRRKKKKKVRRRGS